MKNTPCFVAKKYIFILKHTKYGQSFFCGTHLWGGFEIQHTQTPEGKPYQIMHRPYYLGTQLYAYLEYFIK
jgi:hypothetical protein